MAAYNNVSVTITNAGNGMVTISVGAETHTLPVQVLRAFFRRELNPLHGLLLQMAHVLDAAGIDPSVNLAGAKSAIEAGSYKY